jgi:hypothetical protein
MNNVKKVNGAARLVGLKMSDEVPTHLFAPDFGDLTLCFLDAVLTKVCRPELTKLFDNCRRMGLADGDEPDRVRLAPAPLDRGINTRANVRKSYCQWFLHRINVSHEIEFDTKS